MKLGLTRMFVLVVAMALLAAACGGGGGASETTTTAAAPVTTAAPDSTTTTAPEGITSYDGVQPATIQIIARGTFRDPEVGLASGSGAGSGFIISPDGVAVTNNHVVAGAATLEVFVGGDTTTSYNATILGVSECNDLALIDINEREPLPYLEWYADDVRAGLEVYAAGYPLGDPEFTLTGGIVAKAKAGGDLTGTSSIDHTVEHDANIQPGSSGGPLVSADGKVVAVNYAGGALASSTEQFFAIAADLAEPAVEELRDGDFESLGINGWAVWDESLGLSGIWVAGVAPGSPAAEAELLPGDIITALNGLPMGTDGTFKDYCDVIRTSGEGRAMAVEVLRWDSSEVLRGEINGDEPIQQALSFLEEVEEDFDVDTGVTAYSGYQTVTDDWGVLTVEVPLEWSDINSSPGTFDDGTTVPFITATTGYDAFVASYDVPGMQYVASDPSQGIGEALSGWAPAAGQCTDLGVYDYADGVFTGRYQVWDDCLGSGTVALVLAAKPAERDYTVVIYAQIVSDADWEAVDRIFASFNVIR
jgi:serine protease Do